MAKNYSKYPSITNTAAKAIILIDLLNSEKSKYRHSENYNKFIMKSILLGSIIISEI